jgi:hypothetical protein
MKVHNLLSLPHLPARHTKGKEPLIKFYLSHVVISSKYLDIINRKTMENALAKGIRANKSKEENKQSKRAT